MVFLPAMVASFDLNGERRRPWSPTVVVVHGLLMIYRSILKQQLSNVNGVRSQAD
ncbi:MULTISPECIES: hypothetical protein [Kocuria]|uniref:Uncharacterized protein n=1 Tax=Kocuria subflava TaxID=1736139 RepID=A0A846TNK9_9MICC|nr:MULTISPECIES: hypothetical protein [Kocuria]NKE08379.1 hypothetical protein [Kocuria subflava]